MIPYLILVGYNFLLVTLPIFCAKKPITIMSNFSSLAISQIAFAAGLSRILVINEVPVS
jgi:hypothetical protein